MSNTLFNGNVSKYIEEEIIPKFGFYCNLLKTKYSSKPKIYNGFIPFDTLNNLSDTISDSDKKKIKEIYVLFSEYYLDKLDVYPMFKERYKNITSSQTKDFENIVNTSISLYEEKNKVKLKELFEACFGLRDYGILPRYLQSKIYGKVK